MPLHTSKTKHFHIYIITYQKNKCEKCSVLLNWLNIFIKEYMVDQIFSINRVNFYFYF